MQIEGPVLRSCFDPVQYCQGLCSNRKEVDLISKHSAAAEYPAVWTSYVQGRCEKITLLSEAVVRVCFN